MGRRTRRNAVITVALLAAIGCNDSTGPDDDGSLLVDVLDSGIELPAKVSVLFRVSTLDGDPVAGITVDEVELLDNGEPESQFESSKAFESRPGRFQTSVALLLDLSGSITGSESLPVLKQAAGSFVDRALEASEVVVGVWWFDGSSDLVRLRDFTDDAAALKAAIDGLSEDVIRDNTTNLNGAIVLGVDLVRARLDDPAFRDVSQAGSLVVFTDGTDLANRVSQTAALQAVQEAPTNMSIYSIGLRGEIDESFLTQIGRSGSAFADDTGSLLTEFASIGQEIEAVANSVYLLVYCSPRRSGATNQLTIRVRHEGRQGEGTLTYPAANFTGGCQVP